MPKAEILMRDRRVFDFGGGGGIDLSALQQSTANAGAADKAAAEEAARKARADAAKRKGRRATLLVNDQSPTSSIAVGRASLLGG